MCETKDGGSFSTSLPCACMLLPLLLVFHGPGPPLAAAGLRSRRWCILFGEILIIVAFRFFTSMQVWLWKTFVLFLGHKHWKIIIEIDRRGDGKTHLTDPQAWICPCFLPLRRLRAFFFVDDSQGCQLILFHGTHLASHTHIIQSGAWTPLFPS